MKLTKRKGFNFFRSYYDVYNELSDNDKVAFMDALLDRQFLGKKPTDLKGMAKFAYISQTNSIDSQVKGYEDKTGTPLDGGGEPPTVPPTVPPMQGGADTPTEQVQEKEKEKEKNIVFSFEDFWSKYPSKVAKQKCKEKYSKIKDAELKAIKDTIGAFVKYKPFEGYTHPNPLTYLNQKRWEDEIPETEKPREQETMEETILRIKKERGWIS